RLSGSAIPPTADSFAAAPKMPAVCHVWTAPAVQEESDASANGRVRSCIRPVVAAAVAAGHDVIRGSGPNQKHALVRRVAHNGVSRSNSTLSHQRRHPPCNPRRNRLHGPQRYLFIAKPRSAAEAISPEPPSLARPTWRATSGGVGGGVHLPGEPELPYSL